jgi:4-amino-4-deoxy-L-arabinose transferase-like glycosyltransferase
MRDFLRTSSMNGRIFSYTQLGLALLAGLALRLYFIVHFPFYAGDTKFYEELARNWLDHGVYGLFVMGQLAPVDMRTPGYPGFLAAIYFLLGRASRTVMLVQAFLDLGTCVLTALIAARLAPVSRRRAVATVALWIAALCPFTADYTAVVLTETLAIFLTALALLVIVYLLSDPAMDFSDADFAPGGTLLKFAAWFLLAGFIVGLGTLVRPETPLVLVAAGLVLCARWRRRGNWPKLILAGCWMCVGLLFALLPWAARNARTLGRIEFLGPRYAQSYGDFIPRGFFAWTQTWMTRFGDAYLVNWKLGKEPLRADALPVSAFDSDAEHARVTALLVQYNADLRITSALDHQFAVLARERTARRPWRTYVSVPAQRILAMWFTPRVELLPYSGEIWPLSEKWRENRADFGVTLAFGILGIVYAGLALCGLWRWRGGTAGTFLVLFVVIRTVALTQLQTVEPRYVIECFPVVLAFGALAWAIPWRQPSMERDTLRGVPDVVSE